MGGWVGGSEPQVFATAACAVVGRHNKPLAPRLRLSLNSERYADNRRSKTEHAIIRTKANTAVERARLTCKYHPKYLLVAIFVVFLFTSTSFATLYAIPCAHLSVRHKQGQILHSLFLRTCIIAVDCISMCCDINQARHGWESSIIASYLLPQDLQPPSLDRRQSHRCEQKRPIRPSARRADQRPKEQQGRRA